MVQWIDLWLLDEALLRGLVATLLDVFPAVRVYHPIPSSLYFLASDTRLDVEAAAERGLALAPKVVSSRGVRLPEDVAAALVLDENGARRFAEGASLNTDDHNRLAARGANRRSGALDSRALVHWLMSRDELARADLERARALNPSFRPWQERFKDFEKMFFGIGP